MINIYPSSVHLEGVYQRQKSAASQAATPEQLRQPHNAAASAGANGAELEGSIMKD